MTTAETDRTAAAARDRTPSSASERSDFWRATLRGWTIAFGVGMTLAAAVVVVQVDDGGVVTRTLLLLAGIVVGYVLLAVPAARRGDARLAHAYLALVCVLTSLAVVSAPISVVLLFIVYAQVWFFGSSRRVSLLFTLALTIGVFGGFAWLEDFSPTATRDSLVQGAFAALFSTLLGLWVTYIAEQSEVRAELLAELQAAQDELTRVSHDAGVTAERERLAREIHDTIAQGLASVVVLAQTAEAAAARGDTAATRDQLGLIEASARENLAEARALVAAFAPVALDGSSLVEALDRLGARFAAETGIAIDVHHEGGVARLGREHEVVLLRVAQEALTNVRRHAGATAVRLRLSVRDGVVLEIADDGRGIAPDRAEGFGLRGMRERVQAAGGSIELGAPPAGGTIVQVRLPREEMEAT